MFPRRDRLSRLAFSHPGRLGRLSSPYFSAVIPPGHGYAIVIPKKLLRRAVDRHRLKRRIIAALRHPPPLPLPQARLIYPKDGVLALSPPELRAELTHLLTNN